MENKLFFVWAFGGFVFVNVGNANASVKEPMQTILLPSSVSKQPPRPPCPVNLGKGFPCEGNFQCKNCDKLNCSCCCCCKNCKQICG
ncbi:protein E6A [Equid gammaherpesvirus 5]|uniref:Protein E6A n=1 Tax=Equid gammaherpesvirus 5 TaxID=10371 RepID=A0A0B4Q607_9GAMA|nr:protein E6A [Equid gammaherpesvirus 5]AIU39540.1 protein E6A [Equid gammaherpesvirus 5]APT43447.1 protein E6A [Equid gammaherpesvirus 5]